MGIRGAQNKSEKGDSSVKCHKMYRVSSVPLYTYPSVGSKKDTSNSKANRSTLRVPKL